MAIETVLRSVQGILPAPGIKLQLAAVSVALVMTFASAVLDTAGETERRALALPEQDTLQPWHEEVLGFAMRMERAFGLRSDVALEFSEWILEASARQDLSPELIASLVFTESSFRKDVESHVGAVGPAQVRPYWRGFCGTSSLSEPAENIYCGAQILAYFKDSCGAERCALLAYNLGPHGKTLERFASAGARYVSRIDTHLERFDGTAL